MSTEPDEYEFADDPAPQKETAPVPARPLSPPVIPTLARDRGRAARTVGYARPGTVGESTVNAYFPDRVKDLYLPLALIGIGTVVEVGVALLTSTSGVVSALAETGLSMLLNTAVMLVTVFVVAKLRSISFGPVLTAIVKLCGISIGPGAIGTVLGWILSPLGLLGALIGLIVGFILYFACIGALFDLDESDTWAVVIAVWIAKVLIFIVVLRYFFTT